MDVGSGVGHRSGVHFLLFVETDQMGVVEIVVFV